MPGVVRLTLWWGDSLVFSPYPAYEGVRREAGVAVRWRAEMVGHFSVSHGGSV